MKFKNHLGDSETIHMRGLSPKNEPIRARRLDSRRGGGGGGAIDFECFSPCISLNSVFIMGLHIHLSHGSLWIHYRAFIGSLLSVLNHFWCSSAPLWFITWTLLGHYLTIMDQYCVHFRRDISYYSSYYSRVISDYRALPLTYSDLVRSRCLSDRCYYWSLKIPLLICKDPGIDTIIPPS